MVGCEARSGPDGRVPCRQLERRIGPQTGGGVAVLIAGGDHQHAELEHIGKAVDNLILRARIRDAARQTFGDAKALLDLPQNQNSCVRRRNTVKTRHDRLAMNR